MDVPAALSYSEDHEWIAFEGRRARIGLTDFAQSALGDVVFVDLPSLGEDLAAGDVLGEVESTKAVSELYAPLSGQVAEVNDALAERPAMVNSDPYGEGWICVLMIAEGTETTELLSARDYETLTQS